MCGADDADIGDAVCRHGGPTLRGLAGSTRTCASSAAETAPRERTSLEWRNSTSPGLSARTHTRGRYPH